MADSLAKMSRPSICIAVATEQELPALPQVGAMRAAAIINARLEGPLDEEKLVEATGMHQWGEWIRNGIVTLTADDTTESAIQDE